MNRTTDGDELITYGESEIHPDGSKFEAGSFHAIRFGSGTKGAANTGFHRVLAWCGVAIIVAWIANSVFFAIRH